MKKSQPRNNPLIMRKKRVLFHGSRSQTLEGIQISIIKNKIIFYVLNVGRKDTTRVDILP